MFSARKTWEVRSHMLDVAGNFPAHKKIRELKLDVPGMWGSGQGRPRAPDPVRRIRDLRGDADLENQEELVKFFSKVMDRRKEKNWD